MLKIKIFLDITLCTKTIATRVKEVLIQNQISQKLFGRVLLKLAESTVSLLLSKPKCWKILSHRGREPYCKMYLWLNDPHGIQKIKMWIHNSNNNSVFNFLLFIKIFF